MKSVNANKINRKSGVAEGPAVSPSGTANVPSANYLRVPLCRPNRLHGSISEALN